MTTLDLDTFRIEAFGARPPAEAPQPAPARTPARRVLDAIGMVALVAAVVAWALLLRPQFLGGPAQFVVISGTSMEPGLHTGDLVLVHRQDAYRIGDVVAYRVPKGEAGAGRVIIHRIIGGSADRGYVLRGDNRKTSDFWQPKPAQVVGKMKVPLPGRPLKLLRSPPWLAFVAGLVTFVLFASRRGDDGGDN